MKLGIFQSKNKPKEPEEVRQAIIDFLLLSKGSSKDASTSLSDETDLKNNLGMDSIDIVELMVHLERKYDLDYFEAENIPPLLTIGVIADFIFQLSNQ